MQAAISSTFLASQVRLTRGDARRAVEFIRKMNNNPSSPGLGLEQVQNAADPNLSSARITLRLRAILHKVADRYTILYAGLHDDASEWAQELLSNVVDDA